MRSWTELEDTARVPLVVCATAREEFSAYLDGALDGRSMTRLAHHLETCQECAEEFAAWRSMQSALSGLGPAKPPIELQAQLRDVLATEISTGRHRSPAQRFRAFWRATVVPAGLRVGAGLAATSLILGSATWFLSTALPVQANDDRLAHMTAPRLLYSQMPAEPIASSQGVGAVLVDAKVDANGRVYDFDLLEGPKDQATRLRIESNLLGSVFQPATVFGEPVPGHAMMTYTTVSARS